MNNANYLVISTWLKGGAHYNKGSLSSERRHRNDFTHVSNWSNAVLMQLLAEAILNFPRNVMLETLRIASAGVFFLSKK